MNIIKAFNSQIAQTRTFNRPARLFLLATIIDGIAYSGWNLFFNFYILERGYSREFLGLVNAVPSIAILLFGVLMGQLSDRIGRKRAMLAGASLSIICMALEVTFTQPALILTAAFVNGVASALYMLSQAPFMMKASNQENRTLLFSLNFGLVTISGAVGNLFAGQLPAIFGGWLGVSDHSAAAYQAVLLCSLILGLGLLVPLALIRETDSRDDGCASSGKKASLPSLWSVLSDPLTIKLSLPNLLVGWGAAILIPYMNVFFAEKFKVSDASLGILFAASSVLTGLGTIIGPRLSDELGSKIRALVICQAASLAFLMLMGFSPLLGLVSISFLMRGTLMNMAQPLYDAFSMEQVAENRQGTVNSVRSLAWQSGWAVGPYLSGIIQQAYGFTPLFVATGVLYGLAIAVTWLFFGHKETAKASLVAMEDEDYAAEPAIEAAGD